MPTMLPLELIPGFLADGKNMDFQFLDLKAHTVSKDVNNAKAKRNRPGINEPVKHEIAKTGNLFDNF